MVKTIPFLFFCFVFSINLDAQVVEKSTYFPQNLNAKRSEIVLNGSWLFQPAILQATKVPDEKNWDMIQVPSSWSSNYLLDSIKKDNKHTYNVDTLSRAWYQTKVFIPKSWAKNSTILHLDKVSTDAAIYVNNNFIGNVHWYTGELDISLYVNYGKENVIKILVIAAANEGEIPVLMGTATSQVSFTKAVLATRGLIGDVVLNSRPTKSYISDVFVKTSVRKKNIEFEVELVGIKDSSTIKVLATILNKEGEIEKTYLTNMRISKRDTQLLHFSFDWDNPKLWDINQPNLYTLKLAIQSKNTIDDIYNQIFGFREFWIEGKDFYLNGSKINLRPHLFVGGNGMDELIDSSIDGIMQNGFNISEIWPNNFDERGFLEHSERMMDRADKKGYLLMGVSLPFVQYMLNKSWSYQWDKPEVKIAYEKRMLINLKKDRNHPSVVMWTTSGNFFGDSQDQNPINIGKVNWVKNKPTFQKYLNAGLEAISLVKKHDPTRPIFSHHGTYVGDVHTLNFYLSFIPLQEREEWMSEYAKAGQIPFIGVELGTPLFCDFLRGRNGYGNNIKTEPLITEFSASYLGNKAYIYEPKSYKQYIVSSFIKDQDYIPMLSSEVEPIWAFQQVQKLFITNTWRSWRTYQVSGGVLPWVNAHGWLPSQKSTNTFKYKTFKFGTRGYFYPKVALTDAYDKQEPGYQILSSGQALVDNNSETLAYIAGSKDAFTAKDHNFKPEQLLQKQLFFFNDTRKIQKATWSCIIKVADKEVYQNNGSNLIEIGGQASEDIYYKLPKTANFRTSCTLVLTAQIAGNAHTDTLHFTIFNHQVKTSITPISVFDPIGKTKQMLLNLGFNVTDWDGRNQNTILCIGRDALSKGFKVPTSLQTYVKNGGRLLIFNQQDTTIEKHGFRVAKYVSRYVFPLPESQITNQLNEIDLRNWAGVGTMNQAYPDYMNVNFEKSPDESPLYGWRWGNRGSVATNAIEKPHHSGWTPLLECEFDMAYTPLMELNYGKGKVIWCSLDLEDHFKQDVVAEILVDRLINYTITSKIYPRSKQTIFLGKSIEAVTLQSIGLKFNTSTKILNNTELVICGTLTESQKTELIAFVKKGGKAIIMPQNTASSLFNVTYTLNPKFNGGESIVKTDITNGLSISDIRYRTPVSSVLISKGCDIYANGLIGKKNIGKGYIVFCQIDPTRFKADTLTYNRYTRWRSTRALTQILSNLGATFLTDENVFKQADEIKNSIDLDKTIWKAKMTLKLPAVSDIVDKHKDNGITKEAMMFVSGNADESLMKSTNVPMTSNDPVFLEMQEFDGEVVLRKDILIPQTMVGKDLILNLSVIDDFDETYFNGVKVGSTNTDIPETWNYNRTYTIPSKLVKLGRNSLAIRIFDWYGGGGLTIGPQKREISLMPKDVILPNSMYHEDYRKDFDLGDNPFRYFRW